MYYTTGIELLHPLVREYHETILGFDAPTFAKVYDFGSDLAQ